MVRVEVGKVGMLKKTRGKPKRGRGGMIGMLISLDRGKKRGGLS